MSKAKHRCGGGQGGDGRVGGDGSSGSGGGGGGKGGGCGGGDMRRGVAGVLGCCRDTGRQETHGMGED
eukprot:scaffold16952_cov118-Isochrysis_galbana.AAC.2